MKPVNIKPGKLYRCKHVFSKSWSFWFVLSVDPDGISGFYMRTKDGSILRTKFMHMCSISRRYYEWIEVVK